MSSSGLATYHSPEDDGSGSGDGGGGCSSGGDDGEPDDTLAQLRRSANACDPVPVAPMCLPVPGTPMDTSCYRPLTTSDLQVIHLALDSFLVPTEQIADTLARRLCKEGAAAIRSALANGMVFGGRTDTPLDDKPHEAGTDPTTGRVHIDPWHLADAKLTTSPSVSGTYKAELALTLVHEGLHVDSYPAHLTNEPYSESPWNLFNSPQYQRYGATPSPCVKWN